MLKSIVAFIRDVGEVLHMAVSHEYLSERIRNFEKDLYEYRKRGSLDKVLMGMVQGIEGGPERVRELEKDFRKCTGDHNG